MVRFIQVEVCVTRVSFTPKSLKLLFPTYYFLTDILFFAENFRQEGFPPCGIWKSFDDGLLRGCGQEGCVLTLVSLSQICKRNGFFFANL